jgi:uncharacterized membrane protein YecN with MAPEG domain
MVREVAANALAFSASYIAVLILIGLVLTARVILVRRTKLIGIGDGGDRELHKRIRVHGNFCENAPALIALLIVLPLLGGKEWLIHLVGLMGVVGRVLHAIGLSKTAGTSLGRVTGMVMTLTALGIGAIALLVLAWR